MDKLIGRERECEELDWAVKSQRSELVILYGRRRVGKTFLVRRFFDDTYSFHYVGAPEPRVSEGEVQRVERWPIRSAMTVVDRHSRLDRESIKKK